MWNQIEINWNIVTLFEIQLSNLLDGINHDFISIHIKKKKCECVNEHSFYSKSRR